MESLLNMINTDPNTTGIESFNHSVAIMVPKWQNTAHETYKMRVYATYINHTIMQDEKVQMNSTLQYNKNRQDLVAASGQKRGVNKTPILDFHEQIHKDPASIAHVIKRKSKIDRLHKYRLGIQNKLIEKVGPIEEVIGLSPVVVKPEPTVREGILSGAQSAGSKLGLPKPPHPFKPINLLLNNPERENAMKAIWEYTLKVRELKAKRSSNSRNSTADELSDSDDSD
jgi:hypothetical protein